MQEERPLTVRCACGWEAVGSEDEVVAATQEHGRRIHNMLPTRDEVLVMVIGSADEKPGADRAAESHSVPRPG